jgi:heme-degrading monooxygenase HmoA
MFVRATSFQTAPDFVDGAIRFAVRETLAASKEVPGFVGLIDLVNRETGKAIVLSFWESAEAREASTEFGRKVSSSVAEKGGESITSVDVYEVGLFALPDGLVRRPAEGEG